MTTDPRLAAVLLSGVHLPAPSQSMLRLRKSLADDRTGPREIAAIVAQDPVFAGALMRIGHSAVFHRAGHALTLLDIVARLGGARTLAIGISGALHQPIDGVPPRVIDRIWQRSVDVAGVVLDAALRRRRRDLADDAYLAALVHEAGLCVVLRRFPLHADAFASAPSHEAAAHALDAATGTDHAAVGMLIARNWKLPAAVGEAIRVHHQPVLASADAPDVAAIAALLAFGRAVLDGPGDDWARWRAVARAQLGLSDDALADARGLADAND